MLDASIRGSQVKGVQELYVLFLQLLHKSEVISIQEAPEVSRGGDAWFERPDLALWWHPGSCSPEQVPAAPSVPASGNTRRPVTQGNSACFPPTSLHLPQCLSWVSTQPAIAVGFQPDSKSTWAPLDTRETFPWAQIFKNAYEAEQGHPPP